MAKGLGIREYARHRNVSHVAVLNALRDGRIHKAKNGKIDPDLADAAWEASTDPTKPKGPPKGRKHGSAGNGSASSSTGIAKARAVEAVYKAKTARVEFLRLEARLVDAARVARVAFETARRGRDLLIAMEDRLARALVGCPDVKSARKIIGPEIRKVCEEISKRPFGTKESKEPAE